MILFPDQLLAIVYMLFAGWFYAFALSFYNRICQAIQKYKLSILLDIGIQFFLMYIVYKGMYKINYAIFNIYVWIIFVFGIFLYDRYYSVLFLSAFEQILKILRIILYPIHFAHAKFSVIIIEHSKTRRHKICQKQRTKRLLRKEN